MPAYMGIEASEIADTMEGIAKVMNAYAIGPKVNGAMQAWLADDGAVASLRAATTDAQVKAIIDQAAWYIGITRAGLEVLGQQDMCVEGYDPAALLTAMSATGLYERARALVLTEEDQEMDAFVARMAPPQGTKLRKIELHSPFTRFYVKGFAREDEHAFRALASEAHRKFAEQVSMSGYGVAWFVEGTAQVGNWLVNEKGLELYSDEDIAAMEETARQNARRRHEEAAQRKMSGAHRPR